MSVRLKKTVTESRYGQNFSSRSSSRRLEQVDDQGMRDDITGKKPHVVKEIQQQKTDFLLKFYLEQEKGVKKETRKRCQKKRTQCQQKNSV